MASRAAGRIITGPAAFLIAGLIDIGLFVLAVLHHRLRERLGSR